MAPGSAQRSQSARSSRRLTVAGRLGACALLVLASGAAAADQARISALSDVAFGTIASFTSDWVRSQSVCLSAKSPPTNLYRITATGSGAGGSFVLDSGSEKLSYDVQWADSSGQTAGTQLVPNQPLTAQQSSVGSSDPGDCSKGPATTASLIVILRSSALAAASSGTYSGSLTLLVAPE